MAQTHVLIGHEWIEVAESSEEVLGRIGKAADSGEAWISLQTYQHSMRIHTRVVNGVREYAPIDD